MKLNVATLVAVLIFFCTSTWAQTEDAAQPEAPKSLLQEVNEGALKAGGQVNSFLGETRTRRSENDYFALLNYAPMDLILPSKYGVTLGWISTPDVSWEFEYLHGSIPFLIKDIGSMSDDRYSFIRRSYFGSNSFNLSYGLTYFDFSAHLGDKFLNNLSGGNYPAVDLFKIQSLGFNIGIGNRWSFKHNITFGIDWVSWSQPVWVTTKDTVFLDYASNQKDKDDVNTAVKIVSYFPRISVLKLQLGILF